jgi:hypothetical protein
MAGATLGRTWRTATAERRAPLAAAASRKSARRSRAVSVSATLAIGGMRITVRAMMAFEIPDPSAAAIVIASRTAGKA